MRKLYGSTSWRRVLALVLVFVMMLSMMGTSGYSVFAEDLVETEEEVVAAPEEAVVEDITDTVLGESPGEDEEAPAEDAEAVEAVEEAEEAPAELSEEEAAEGEDAEAVEDAEEEAVEELGEDAEPAEEAEEAEPAEDAEEADLEEESEEEAEEPAEEAEEDLTLIAEAAQVIKEDDGAEAPTEEPAEEPAAEEEPAVEEPADPSLVADVVKQLEDGQVVEEEPVVEEIPEEAPVEEPEIAYPAVGFRDIIGGVSVTVEAPEGAFPEGTEMKLAEVEIESIMDAVSAAVEGEITKVKAVDITFLYEGEEIQPELPIAVKMNASGMTADSDRQVLHIEESGEATVLEDADTSKKAVEFEADSFSVYVVVQTGDDARLTVNFHKADGTTETMLINKRQLDKIEQYIVDPGAGTPEDAFFKGWTTVEAYTAETTPVMTIEQIREDIAGRLNVEGGIQDGTVVDYYAMAFHSYVISYLDEDGIAIKSDQILYPIGDTSTHQYTVENPYVPKYAYDTTSGASREFGGWQQISPQVETPPIYQYGDQFELSSDIVLRATINTGYWVIFNANLNNATFTGPVFAPYVGGEAGAPSSEPDDPTCPGYTFQGWYTGTPKGNGEIENPVEFSFDEPLTATTTVYGLWTKNTTATYHVIIWQQSLEGVDAENNKLYDYKETITVNNHAAGTNTYQITTRNNDATARIFTGAGTNQYTDKSYTGFHVGSIDAQKPVEADNTTVINVYFDRNEHTLTFRQYQGSGTVYKTITALYGQNIRDNFPITSNGAQSTWRWEPHNSSTFNQVLVYIDVMPDENVVFTPNTANFSTKTIHYMVEALPGQTATRTYNGMGFVEYKAVDANYNFFTEAEDYIALDGFTKGDSNSLTTRYIEQAYTGNTTTGTPSATGNSVWGTSYRHVFVYYVRNNYSIEYEDGTFFDLTWDSEAGSSKEVPLVDPPVSQNIDTKDGIKYEQNINNNTYNFTPTKATYVFAGWYKDVNCTEPYTFGTMPSNNFKLYAKWLTKVYKVNLVPNDTEGDSIRYVDENQSEHFYVDCNEKIADMSSAERNYWELIGWYTDPEFTHSYDFAVIPINDDYIEDYGDPTYRESDWPATYGQVTLYARWRSKLIGSDGIEIEYDVTEKGTGAAQDEKSYVDLAEAIAATAVAAADPDTYVFSHWNVQHWNGSEYEDSGVSVYPGEIYEVKVDDSKIVNTNTGAVVPRAQYNSLDPNGSYSYTVVLKAEFIEKDQEILTFINWYNNYDDGLVTKSENLKINQATPIPAAPTRDGYTFKGWIRGLEEKGKTTTFTDLWLTYRDGKYYDVDGNEATNVAADEHLVGDDPNEIGVTGAKNHHALYAKWEPITYTVIFDKNAEAATGTMENQTFTYDEEQALNANAFALTNYRFLGWSEDASATTATYTDKQSVKNLTTEAGAEVTLYAIWELDVADVTVHHYLKDTTTKVAEDVTESATISTEYTAQPASTFLSGFDGYKLTADSYNPSQKVTVSADGNTITVYYTLPLTITATTASKEYDGTPLNGAYTIEGELSGDKSAIETALGTAPSITEVTESPLEYLTEEEQADITGIPGYYVVSYESGTLTITASGELTVTATGYEGKYDGASHAASATPSVTEGTTVEYKVGDGEWTTTAPSIKDVGEQVVSVRATNANYEAATAECTLKVTPRSVTLTSADDEKVYDGEALTNDEITEGGDGFVEGEGASYEVTGSQTEVGSSENEFSYTLNEGTKAGNYQITTAFGTLEVTKSGGLTVTATGYEGKYDGASHAASATPSVTEGTTIEYSTDGGKTWSETAPSIKDVGEQAFTVRATNPNYESAIANESLKVTPRSVILTSADDEKVYDGEALNNDEVTEGGDGFVKGEGATYDVTGSQTLVGSSDNTFSYTLNEGTKADNYKITKVEGTLTVTDKDVPAGLVVTKIVQGDAATTGTAAAQYKLGDTVTFAITATNIYAEAKTITLSEIEGVTLAQSTFENVEAGATIETTATYTIKEADVLAGKFINTVTAKIDDLERDASAEVNNFEETNGHLTVEKETTSQPAEGEAYALGETITYKITVTNDGNLTITDITVTDELTEDEWTIESLAPGEDEEFETSYTVTEADILAGEVVNVATAAGTSPDPDEPEVPVTPGEDPEPTEELDTTLSVKKAVTNEPADGKAFKLGEKIEYKITVKNEGNATYSNVQVVDKATGLSETIETLAVGESKEFTTSHVVTEDDILAGSFTNTATAEGDPINGKTPQGEDTVTTGDEGDPDDPDDPPTPPIEELDTTLSVKKAVTNEPADGKAFKLGEKIEYKITVKNEGNATYSNVQVVDKATGLSETIETLAVGESKEFTTSHVVTEDDILAGSFTNTATAAGDPINGKTPEGEDTVTTGDEGNPDDPDDPPTPPIEDLDTTLTVEKTIENEPADGKAFKAGETIEYKITVKNEGNVPYYNVVVKDALVGLEETIEVLPTGEKGVVEYTRSYTVTEEDIVAGEVANTATAKADEIKDPKEPNDPKTPEGEDTITTGTEDNPPIADKESSMTVNKVVTSKPADGKAYALGEEITYEITVSNTGNVTIRNITVSDELTGDEWTIESLAPGKTSEAFTASYTVTEDDTKAGEVVNTATAAGSGPQGNDPTVTPGTVPAETKQTIIYYTNYPVDGMTNEYSEVFDVTPGYTVADFLTVFTEAPSGYEFSGWKDQKSGTAYSVGALLKALAAEGTGSLASVFTTSEATDADGTANVTATPDADYVLYAQWTKIKKDKDDKEPTPPVDEPEEPIEEPDTPLAPYEEPDEPIEEPDTPLAPAEEDTTIDEEPTPLSPFTGDDRHTAVWGLVSLLSLAGIAVVARKRKEEEQ